VNSARALLGIAPAPPPGAQVGETAQPVDAALAKLQGRNPFMAAFATKLLAKKKVQTIGGSTTPASSASAVSSAAGAFTRPLKGFFGGY
jgi:hypothetical protein